jgi:rsbT co-antagonist protein RsbR
MAQGPSRTARVLAENQSSVLANWIEGQRSDRRIRPGVIPREELARHSQEFLDALLRATASGNLEDPDAPEYGPVKQLMADITAQRLQRGMTRLETAACFICFKDFWTTLLPAEFGHEPDALNREVVAVCKLIDTLALAMYEDIVAQAEATIRKQAREILELSTPVVQVWEGVVAAPLIGSLDSQRTQQFMERLLERIVATNSPVALVDITGVPTIDTQTAQHLIETITAVKLLGAQVVLTGVRPATAQTLVHLGIDLSGVSTRASLSAGLRVAMEILDLQVVGKNGRA